MRLKLRLGQKLDTLFSGKREKEELLSEIEEILISSDFGISFTKEIIDELNKRVSSFKREELIHLLKGIIKERISLDDLKIDPGSLDHRGSLDHQGTINAHLIFGVNGSGKTTTVGKLAYKLKCEEKKVLIAAADTFRDAAVEQLAIWSRKANVPLIQQHQGSDPGAVVYDACEAAKSRAIDALIIDTAGRLHNKERLMEELKKIGRILDKQLPEAHKSKLLTLDATTGQNAISQATLFNEYIGVNGIILTKLDSSAKGGVACSISGKLRIPILYAGVGEKVTDLIDFDIDEYLNILFS